MLFQMITIVKGKSFRSDTSTHIEVSGTMTDKLS
jgi:hypothetical protein